jgi:hypothetical protein
VRISVLPKKMPETSKPQGAGRSTSKPQATGLAPGALWEESVDRLEGGLSRATGRSPRNPRPGWRGFREAVHRARARGMIAALASLLVGWSLLPVAIAAEPLPLVSAGDAERVFVSGIEERFDAVRAAVEKAAADSGRNYRVVVVGDAGGGDAATKLLEGLIERWRRESAGGDGGTAAFDPAKDVTIVLDVQGRQIAMRAPWGLEVSSGLDPQTIKTELIEKVFVPKAKDDLYDEGLAALVNATERWVRDRAALKQKRAEAARVFRTRTLPIGAAALATFGGLAAFFLQRARHDKKMHEARTKLAAFKGEVVALSDLLDTQQERHRMLPHSDPDFVTPMEGLTRSTYDGVQGAIRRYRERWLSLMDVWEKAEGQINSEWFLGTSAADEAIKMLDSAEARPPLDAVAGECRAPLDALEQAHETARSLADTVEADLATATQRVEAVASRGRSNASFQRPLAEAARGLSLARHDVENDPVAARGRLENTATALAAMTEVVETFEAVDDRRLQAIREADAIEEEIRSRRAAGWLLHEPGAVPDELVATARREIDLAAQLLDFGEAAGGRSHVENAEQANAEARAMLESITAARARVEDLLPGCITRLAAAAEQRVAAVRAVEHLAGTYAETSWTDVADNISRADEGVARVKTLVAEAQAAADGKRQHYFRALALAEEAVRQVDWAEDCYHGAIERSTELDQLRSSLPARRNTVHAKVADLERQLSRQRTDRVRANERCREAGRLVEAADHGLAMAQPDLRQVSQVLDAADAAAARATDLAAEDERLARQAIEDLEETDSLVRRVAAWYAEGVSANVQPATAALERGKAFLTQQRYEDSIKSLAEATHMAKEAYAAATAEAERRRHHRQLEIQRRQMEESFTRMSRGFGPWVIQLPGGTFTGPDPWRSMRSGRGGGFPMPSFPASRSSGGGWSNNTTQVGW